MLLPAAFFRGCVFWLQLDQPVNQKHLHLAQHLFDSIQGPLTSSPFYTAWIYLVSIQLDLSTNCLRCFQFLAGLMTIGVLVHTAWILTNRKSAMISGIIYGLTESIIVYESDLTPTTMVILAQAIAFWLVVKNDHETKSARLKWLVVGVFTGVIATNHPGMVLILPLLAMHFWFSELIIGHKFKQTVFLFAGACLIISPITLCNYLRTAEFIPITASAGRVFYSSNNFRSTGLGSHPPAVLNHLENPIQGNPYALQLTQDEAFRLLASRAVGMDLTYKESSRYFLVEGWRYLARNPIKSMTLWSRKFFYVFNNYEVFESVSLILASDRIRRYLPFFFPGAVLIVFGILGFQATNLRSNHCWYAMSFMVCTMAVGVAFGVTGCYRLPLYYCFASFSGAGLLHLINLVRSKDPSIWMTVFMIMGLFAFSGYRDETIISHEVVETPSQRATARGVALFQSGDPGAEKMLLRAVKTDPLGSPVAWKYLSELYRDKGHFEMAMIYADRASGLWKVSDLDRLFHSQPETGYDLLMARARSDWDAGNQTSALMGFTEATIRFPDYPDPWFNRAKIVAVGGHDWKEVERCAVMALDRGMKFSLESTAVYQLRLTGFEKTDQIGLAEKMRQQIQWETNQVFNFIRLHE